MNYIPIIVLNSFGLDESQYDSEVKSCIGYSVEHMQPPHHMTCPLTLQPVFNLFFRSFFPSFSFLFSYSPPSSAEFKNVWCYTSTPPIRLHCVVLS